eukprot:TRINITY_DN7971_c0_g2_i2.p3 TRINITY_DN7971_c0_g2~~TRINITY_DN7971_c0_g2_i2.p3  ORF type:complete len:157 (-),score=33.05 TRINITY_DN7971_c0_g2_i2:483-953(-)
MLFWFDHNVSSLLTQKPQAGLRKPPGYNWDFLVLGLIVLLCGFLGVPPPNGLIPQSPLHVTACSEFKTDPETKQSKLVRVYENRASALLQSLGMFMALELFLLIKYIPVAVLDALFVHFALQGVAPGNQFVDRIHLQGLVADRHAKLPLPRKDPTT